MLNILYSHSPTYETTPLSLALVSRGAAIAEAARSIKLIAVLIGDIVLRMLCVIVNSVDKDTVGLGYNL